MSLSLYEQLGDALIADVLTCFYERAFLDPLIGHFFFQHNHQELLQKQILFTSCFLGAQHLTYRGKSLLDAHSRLPLRDAHFRRRQVLLREVLEEKKVDIKLREQWLAREEKLKPLIVNAQGSCHA